MSIDTAKLDEIERGLADVTRGPWEVSPKERQKVRRAYGALKSLGITKEWEDAAHIARCDPQTISELVRLARIGLAAERLHVSALECPVCEDDTYVCAMTPDRYCGMETAPTKTGETA